MPIMSACYCDGRHIHAEEWLTLSSGLGFLHIIYQNVLSNAEPSVQAAGLSEYEDMFLLN